MLVAISHVIDPSLDIYVQAFKDIPIVERAFFRAYIDGLEFNVVKTEEGFLKLSHDNLLDGTIPTASTKAADSFFATLKDKGWTVQAKNLDKWGVAFNTPTQAFKEIQKPTPAALIYKETPKFILKERLGGRYLISPLQSLIYDELLNRLEMRREIEITTEFETGILNRVGEYGLTSKRQSVFNSMESAFFRTAIDMKLIRRHDMANKFIRKVRLRVHPSALFSNPIQFNPSYPIPMGENETGTLASGPSSGLPDALRGGTELEHPARKAG